MRKELAMNRISIKPKDLGKNMGFLKKKKKGQSLLDDKEEDYEQEHYGNTPTTSGNTAEENFADWSQGPGVSNQGTTMPRRASLAGKLVADWKKKRSSGGPEANDDAFFNEDESEGGFDEMSLNYGNDDISVDVTYLEDDGNSKQNMREPESPMSALRKGQKSKQKNKQLKKAMETMTTLDEASSDEDFDDNSTKGNATCESSTSSGDDEYDSFFAYLDKNQDDDAPNPVESSDRSSSKKVKKKKKPKKKGDDGAAGGTKKKKKEKKVKKKIKKKKSSTDIPSLTTSDLLGMVSPDLPQSPKTVDAETVRGSVIPAPDLSLDEPKEEPQKRVDHHAARRALARMNRPQADDKNGLGGLSLDAKVGDSRVDRAARRAIRRSSIGAVGGRPPAMQDGKSRFDAIVDGKASNRPRFRRKSMDVDLRLTKEESETLRSRVLNARPPREGKERHRRKSMDTRLSVEESEALRKKIDKSMRRAGG